MTDMSQNTVPGQEYGAQAAQRRALDAVPMGAQPAVGGATAPRAMPPALNAPTSRPNEPVQAGLPSGPGPGPEALGAVDGDQLTLETLRQIRRQFPSRTIDNLILWMMDDMNV